MLNGFEIMVLIVSSSNSYWIRSKSKFWDRTFKEKSLPLPYKMFLLLRFLTFQFRVSLLYLLFLLFYLWGEFRVKLRNTTNKYTKYQVKYRSSSGLPGYYVIYSILPNRVDYIMVYAWMMIRVTYESAGDYYTNMILFIYCFFFN